jgi:hypothetical protein
MRTHDGLRVNIYAADQGGCGHSRLIWPAEVLMDVGGYDVHLRAESDFTANVSDRADGGLTVHSMRTLPDADVVVLQRPLQESLADVIPHLQAAGIAAVVEIDDDFRTVSRRNVAWESVQPGRSLGRNYLHLERACAVADHVTVSTPALARRYGGHGRVTVLRNCVPRWMLTREAVRPVGAGDRLLVGWSGSTATHPDDLQVTRGAVARALRPHVDTWGFHFIGVDRGKYEVARLLDIDGAGVPYGQTGWADLASGGYASVMGGVDIGIVPLELTAFNQSKSFLKGLEWAALGVPFIASPTDEYRLLTRLGAGALAERPRDWQVGLERLIKSSDARAEAAARGRAVAERMTYEEHAPLWYNAWLSAAAHRARMKVRTNSA